MPISLHVMEETARNTTTRVSAEHAVAMLGGLVTCMWGLAHPLHARGQPINASSPMLISILRTLRLVLDGTRIEAVRHPAPFLTPSSAAA